MTQFKPLAAICLSSLAALISLLAASCAAPVVSYHPSGLPSRIAYSSDPGNVLHIYTIKPDGTDNRTTSTDDEVYDGMPSWSPDGTKIAFDSNQSYKYEIWTMSEDGSNRVKITDEKARNFAPRWSADGSKIVYVGERRSEEGANQLEIFSVNADGSDARQLTDSSGWTGEAFEEGPKERVRWNSVPTWSPDGSRILFSTNRDAGPSPILYTMNPDGSDQRKFGLFFDVDGTEPDWSPVTNQIVFVRGSAAKGEIWVMDGSSLFPLLTAKKLTDNIDNNGSPVWSPDGKQIAFVSDTYGSDDIFIMNADGSNVRRLTYDAANDRHPTWR